MLDLIQQMRLQNLFGQPPAPDPSMGGFSPTSPDMGVINPAIQGPPVAPTAQAPSGLPADYDIKKRMAEIYSPESMAQDRLNTLIGQQPKAADYHPGILRSVLAGLSAFGPGGHKAGMQVLNDPFEKQMSDWENAVKPAEYAANLERQGNVNERQLAYQTVSEELRQQAENHRAANDDRKAAIAEQRAQMYALKSNGAKFDFSGPTVVITKPDGTITQTSIETGKMSQLDKMNLGQEQALEKINTRGDTQTDLEKLKEKNRESLAEKKGWSTANIPDPEHPGQLIGVRINQDTGDVQPIKLGEQQIGQITGKGTGASGPKPDTPTQTRVRQFNAARQIANTRPDLAPFIKFGPGVSDFSISQPGKSMFGGATGPNPNQAKELQSLIYGSTGIEPVASHPQTSAGPTNRPNPNTQPLSRGNTTEATSTGKEKRVTVHDETGKAIATIPDTPEQRSLLKKKHPNYIVD